MKIKRTTTASVDLDVDVVRQAVLSRMPGEVPNDAQLLARMHEGRVVGFTVQWTEPEGSGG